LVLFCGVLFFSSTAVQAQTATPYQSLSDWLAAVMDVEMFMTTSGNVGKADELSSDPGANEDVGSPLTYDKTNTGLSRSFDVKTKETGATFIFDEPFPSYDNALSVGNSNPAFPPVFEDDDWELSLDGSTMNAFGVVLRDNRYESGESISFFSGNTLMDSIDVSGFTNGDVFLGVTADFFFDKVVFDEHPGTDDIAIADFRFATVVPEPSSYILFVSGLSTLGFYTWRRKKSRK
jgi:hypothetical protein